VELVPGFVLLLQGLSATMTAPSFASLTTVLTGWVFASRHTVTRMILAAGVAAEKHFSSYHRLFSAARWSLDALGLAVFDLIQPFLGSVVLLGQDDAPSQRKKGTNGRPRKRGDLLPTPQQMLAGRCRRVTLDIYGRSETARLADQVARGHAAPERPLRVVAAAAVKGGRGQEAFYFTAQPRPIFRDIPGQFSPIAVGGLNCCEFAGSRRPASPRNNSRKSHEKTFALGAVSPHNGGDSSASGQGTTASVRSIAYSFLSFLFSCLEER
jgi:hypothetical protein